MGAPNTDGVGKWEIFDQYQKRYKIGTHLLYKADKKFM